MTKRLRQSQPSLGPQMVQAWHKWLQTEEGKTCTSSNFVCQEKSASIYIKNRLERAFMSGIEAGMLIKTTIPRCRRTRRGCTSTKKNQRKICGLPVYRSETK